MNPWTQASLNQVSEKFIQTEYLNKIDDQFKISQISKTLSFFHQNISEQIEQFYQINNRIVYQTPKAFLQLIKDFIDLVQKQKDQILLMKNKLNSGIGKITETYLQIKDLQEKLLSLQPILIQKTNFIKELIEKLTQDQLQANMVKKIVEQEANEINIQSEKIMILKGEAEIIYKDAIPILNNAIDQLDKLSRGDISEIKNNNNPHNLIKYALECVAILLDEEPDWTNIKKNVLTDANLLYKLKNIKSDNVSLKQRQIIKQKLLQNPQFIPQEMKSINMAAKSLCEWIHAMNNFIDVNQEIQQKKEICRQMEKQLLVSNQNQNQKQKQLEQVIQQVEQLEKVYNTNKAEKEGLDYEMKQTEERLIRANQLTEGLSEENSRWLEKIANLNKDLDLLYGDSLLSVGQIIYFGPFNEIFRNKIFKIWIDRLQKVDLNFSQNHQLFKLYEHPLTLQNWQQYGLSSDQNSIQNAIIMFNTSYYPLIIDPQNQALQFLKNLNTIGDYILVRPVVEGLGKIIEEAIQLGKILILESIEEQLPNIIKPVLKRNYTILKGKKYIQILDELVEVNKNFKFYMISSMNNPHFIPETYLHCCIINFIITKESLKYKLLAELVNQEMPEEEKQRKELQVLLYEDRQLLLKCGEKILELLNNSRGIILDDVELIESLKVSKEISKAVNDKIIISVKKEEELNKGYAMFDPILQRGVSLYLSVQQLQQLNVMYQYSMNFFIKLFLQAVQQTEHSVNRIQIMLKNLNTKIINNICQGTFNKHKTIFLLNIALFFCVYEVESSSVQELNYFINGSSKSIQDSQLPPNFQFTEEQWIQLNSIKNIAIKYIQIVRGIQTNTKQWNIYLQSRSLLQTTAPIELTNLQKLILVKIFRQEIILQEINYFIEFELGNKFIDQKSQDLYYIYEEMNFKTPLIMIIQQGQDPLIQFLDLMKELKVSQENIQILSIGQGQQKNIEKILIESIRNGFIIIIQNCHLSQELMKVIQKQLEQMNDSIFSSEINQSFRLFLQTSPCEIFPSNLLQNCLKMVVEPPTTIKNIMIKNWIKIQNNSNRFEKEQNIIYNKLAFLISLFHAVILERRKFGSVGFTEPYNFNDNDLQTSLLLVKNLFTTSSELPFKQLKYLVANVIYGGRVTDYWDNRLLKYTLDKFFNEEAIQENYKFAENYIMPKCETTDQIFQFCKDIPDFDSPEIFGLNNNANISFNNQNIIDTFQFLKQAQIKDQIQANKQEQLEVVVFGKIKEIQKKLPTFLILNEHFDQNDPQHKFFSQEMERYNILLKNMVNSLRQSIQVIQGIIITSPQINEFLQSFYHNKVPEIWMIHSYLSLKPLSSWFDDFIQRFEFFQNYLTNSLPLIFWFSAFYFPQGFLTSLLQVFSRKIKWAIDTVRFKFAILLSMPIENIKTQPQEGCYLTGLYTEGFIFRSNKQNQVLIEDVLDDNLFNKAPIIHIIPQLKQYIYNPDVVVPIYKTVNKKGTMTTTGQSTNFIIGINVVSTKFEDYWVLKGAAMFCQTPY